MRALAEGERGAAGVCALLAGAGAHPTDKAPKESKARTIFSSTRTLPFPPPYHDSAQFFLGALPASPFSLF